MQVDADDRLTGFLEKPQRPAGRAQHVLASMGIYIFDMNVLVPALEEDARSATQPRLRQGHHPVAHLEGAGLRLPLLRREQEGRRSTGATSARSTPTTKPTWTCATSTRSSTSTIRSGRCARTRCRRRRRSSCSPTKGGAAAQALDSIISAGCIISGSRITRQRALPERARAQLLRRSRTAS